MDKVVHFEIPVDDMNRAKKFYNEIFGWEITQAPVPEQVEEGEYNMITTVAVDENNMPKESGAINGGMMKRVEEDDRPVIVINVPSLDEYLKKIEEMGGKVVLPKQKIMDVGLYARFLDTEGNVIGIWQDVK